MNQRVLLLKGKNQGQALVCVVFTLPLLLACFLLVFFVFQTQAQKLWTGHHLYQSLICLAEARPYEHCKARLLKQSQNFLWMGKIKTISLSQKGDRKWEGVLVWSGFYADIKIKKNLHLDLF